MNKASFELKIALIMLVAVLIVSATGFLAYDRLTSIADSLIKESRPDLKLVILKGIVSDLSDAENHIKTYSITRDEIHLEPYYYTIAQIDEKIDELNGMTDTTSFEMRARIDSVGNLIEMKFRIWDEMLEESKNDPLKKVFSQIKQKIEYKRQRADLERRLDEMELQRENENKEPEEPEIIPEEKPEITYYDEPEKKKSTIFRKLFGRRIGDEMTDKSDDATGVEKPVIYVDKVKLNDANRDEPDTGAIASAPATKRKISERPGKEDIREEIAQIERKEDHLRLKKTARQLQIIAQDKIITDQIRSLISRMEAMEMERIAQKARIIDAEAAKTNQLIAIFCVTTSLLLFFICYIIVRYVRKNRAYQRALKRAKDQAENLAATKEAFMANMSHEIRTPMNSIIGFTEQAIKATNSSDKTEYLKVVKSASEHLMEIINDILDFSKLEASRLSIEKVPFDPGKEFMEVFQMIKIQAERKSLEFNYQIALDVPANVIGDPVRLRQIVLNLIGNAIKFTEEGIVSVNVTVDTTDDGLKLLEVEVKDTGIGIPVDRLDSIFDDFVQAEMSTTRKYGGTGLGLAIARRLIDQQGGYITVDSELGRGSTFRFGIPYEQPEQEDARVESVTKEIDTHVLSGLKILIADDEEYNRLLLKTILKNWGVKFVEAADGSQAVTAMEKGEFDMVLMDVRMPVMDGLQATRIIRTRLKNNIPVIALTAATSREDVDRCMDAGMNDFLSKPFTEEALHKIISKVLGMKDSGLQEDALNVMPVVTIGKSGAFNIDNLLELADGDEKFVREMLQMFITTTRDGVLQIKNGYKENDWKKIADHAHKIASPCRHMEAFRLLDYLKQIESRARNKQLDSEMEELINGMEAEAMEILNAMEITFLSPH